jgi:hypothetical protein
MTRVARHGHLVPGFHVTDLASAEAFDRPPAGGPVHRTAPPDFFVPAATVPSPGEVLQRNILALLVIALLASHIVLAWVSRPPGILTAQDDIEYIVLGQALREGSYRERFRVDAPLHAQYPPGYPALLAVWGQPFEDGFDALVGLSVVLSIATLLVTFATARRLAGPTRAALVLAVLAVNPAMIEMAGAIRSEAAYTFLSMAALLVLMRADEARTGGRSDRALLFVAAFLALGAVFTRTIGITLIVAMGSTWLLRRRFRPAALLGTVCAIPLIAWLAWTARAPDRFVGSSYIAELGIFLSGGATRPPLPQRAVENALDYATRSVPWHLGLPTVAGTMLDNIVLYTVCGALLVAGMVVLRKRWSVALVYLGSYLLLLVVWLWSIDRFVIPIVPLLVTILFAGTMHAMWRRRRVPATAAFTVLAMVMIGGGLYRSLPLAAERLACDRSGVLPDRACVAAEQAAYLDAIDWIGRETVTGAILLAAKPGAVYWYTGRKSISFPASIAQDSMRFLSFVREQGATHVLLGNVDPVLEPRLARRLIADCEGFHVEAAYAQAVIFSLRDAEADEDAAACAAVREAVERVTGRATS